MVNKEFINSLALSAVAISPSADAYKFQCASFKFLTPSLKGITDCFSADLAVKPSGGLTAKSLKALILSFVYSPSLAEGRWLEIFFSVYSYVMAPSASDSISDQTCAPGIILAPKYLLPLLSDSVKKTRNCGQVAARSHALRHG